MTNKLITKSAALLEDRGFSQLTSAQDRQRKSGGITHIVAEHDDSGEVFLVRAKESCYQRLAPFGKGMVDHAQSEDAMLVIYFDDIGFNVADPEYVDTHGEEVKGQSKWESDENRVYLEIGLDDTVGLADYIHGSARPPTVEGGRNTGLGDFL